MSQTLTRVMLISSVFLLMTEIALAAASSSKLRCSQLYLKQMLNSFEAIDPTASRRFFYKFTHNHKKDGPTTIEVIDSDGQKRTIKTPEDIREQLRPSRLLDVATMGVLGDINDFIWDPLLKKVTLKANESRTLQVRRETEEILAQHPSLASEELRQMLQRSLNIQELSERTVMASVPFVRNKDLTEFQQAILNHYQLTGISVVDFVYRYSGLASKKSLAGFTMMDELADIIKKGRGFNFHLVYDKAVWEKNLQLIAARYDQYNRATSAEETQKIINLVAHNRSPFLPSAGMVTTDVFYGPLRPIELKRYFQNPFPDPLSFVQISTKDDFYQRQQMLYQVIKNLPNQSVLEIHAHSEVHLKAYLKLGFKLHEKTENKFYPGVTVNILRGSREQILPRIKATLDKNEVSD